MISKISKLKNFGVFYDFFWKADLLKFEKFNLIYGWNRSGKTTISRVFASCEKKCVYDKDKFQQYPENGEFKIKTSNNTTIKNSNVASNTLLIKVFNKDFVEENISFDPSKSCKPIVYISKEGVETERKLKLLKAKTEPLSQKYQKALSDKESASKIEDNLRISVAQTITQLLTDKKIHDTYYAYDKSNVKEKINKIGVKNFINEELTENEMKEYELISKSKKEKDQEEFQKFQFNFLFQKKAVNDFEKLFEIIKTLLNKKVISETLKRLKDDQALNFWVKQGFDLHKTKKETKKCLFCQKPLDSDFLDSLSKHFNKDYEELQKATNDFKAKVLKLKKEKIALENDELYPNLKESYTTQTKALSGIIEKLNSWVDLVILKLDGKHDNPLVVVTNPEKPKDFLGDYNKVVDKLNDIILNNRKRIKNHTAEVKNAKEKIELHSIAVALSKQNYKEIQSKLKKAKNEEKKTLKAVNKNKVDISELEKRTSNIGKAINKINKYLGEFFGEKEIRLELDKNRKGYTIKRNGQSARNLSESEKTTIAFSYFLVKVGEKEFDIEDGIIFIDDPISSFDSNFVYHSFALIQSAFANAGQLFVSTHNFQLFNLMKDWFVSKNNKRKKQNKNEVCCFYMIENFFENHIRKARLTALDDTLLKFKSEYHFLFSRLVNFYKSANPDYIDFYTIGNIARRFLEIFTNFKIPTTGDLLSKLNSLKIDESKISRTKQLMVYKLVQEFSHGNDTTSTIEHKNKIESQKAIKILLDIIEEADKRHYDLLIRQININ